VAITVRRIDGLQAQRAVFVLNLLRLDLLKLEAGQIFHADASAADVSPTAADLPSVIVMANNLFAEFNAHMASACSSTTGQGAHLLADTTNGPLTTAAAVDQGTADTLLNAIKTAFNAHLTQSGVHAHNDGTNTVAAANATNLGTSITLANALQTAVNAHFAAAFNHQATNLVAP
jgi:hypothetical protein